MRCYIPEDNIHSYRCENLRSYENRSLLQSQKGDEEEFGNVGSEHESKQWQWRERLELRRHCDNDRNGALGETNDAE
jgi:hypothetical protein